MKSIWKGLLAVVAVVFGIYEFYDNWFSKPDYGDSIKVNGTEIFYSGVDTTEVRALANYLETSEFIDGNEKSVKIAKSSKGYFFGGVYDESIWNDSSYLDSGYDFAKELSLYVFDSEPVTFQVCDQEFSVQKEVTFDIADFPYGWEQGYGKTQLFFTSRVNYTEANRLGDYLESQGFTEFSSTVQLDKSDTAYHLNQVTLEDYWNDEEYLMSVHASAQELSKAVFNGYRLVYSLCDAELRIKTSVSSD
ncbi:MAG: hypothetical protein RIC80_17095 [Cyclobacteriaceae bacterium]